MDWFSVLRGHLFSNFPFLPNGVSHFCNFLILRGLLGCHIFLIVLVFQLNFQVWPVEAVLVLDLVGIWLGVNVIYPPNPVFDFLEFCWSELFLPFYISRLVGQVFSVDIRFGMGSALVLIARNFVRLGGVVFTCE